MVAAADSVIRLYPYQQEFFADPARVLVGLWCRQAGKDFTTACLACDNALRTGGAWYIVSLTQRQADSTFAKCRQVGEALKQAFRRVGALHFDEATYDEYDAEIDHHFRCTAKTITFPGGGSVTSLPGRDPDTLAGLTGNVIFTEFGLFPRGGQDHWRVVFPLTTRGFRVVVISTPRGKNTKLYELVHTEDLASVHRVDIHRAVAEGMPLGNADDGTPLTIEDLRRRYNDPVGWRREYELEFTGDLDALISWAKLEAAGQAGAGQPFDAVRIERGAGWRADMFAALKAAGGRPEIGWDVARHRHLSALWINLAAPGETLRRLRYLVLMHACEFALQREVVSAAMQAAPSAVGCGDASGLGMDSNETLTTRYGERWRGVQFTAKSKRELGSRLATAYGDGDQAIPPVTGPDKYVATDLYAIQREVGSEADNLKISESENPLLPESHCDIAYANALALMAGSAPIAMPGIAVL